MTKRRERELEDLLISLDCTFADMCVAVEKGYLQRDLLRLREEVNRIYRERRS